MLKVAITGEQCAGKTTVADILIKQFGGEKIKFIDKIYQINELLGIEKNRGFMQDTGEAIRKYFGQDYFIKDFVHRSSTSKNNLFSDDVRKIIELEAAQQVHFITVFVTASQETRQARAINLGLEFIEHHPAEQEITSLYNKCEIHIENNGSLEKLEEEVSNMFL